MSLRVLIEQDRFFLQGKSIVGAQSVAAFHSLLGNPTRIQASGPPAPCGHRNNQIHFYDTLGLYLNEHHYTHAIEAVTFVLWCEEVVFPTESPFSGELIVGGVHVRPEMKESDMRGSSIPFVSQMRGTWTIRTDSQWIGFASSGRKGPSGRRSKTRYLKSLSVCMRHDPRDTRFRPSVG